MHISMNLDEGLSDLDVRVLKALIGETTTAAPAAGKPAPAKKAAPAAKKPEPEPEPEPEEDLVGDEEAKQPARTKADAIKDSTEMVSKGKAAIVKKALAAVGAKKVSEIPDDQVEEFFAVLEA